SCDVSAPRLKLIAEGAKRLGVRILETRQNDGTVFDASLGEFDRVLCDVPCSGLGVMRRKPELKYRDAASFAGLPAIQYKILATSSQYCKVNGVLVYSTCTINPAENEQVIDRFLAEYPAFEPDLPDGARGETCLPNPTGGDGFFIARVRRRRG
ncbi:MAG: 16S rRNA (cytosine(967)-C(5))-methyltransferase RsmB, partial [Oscillospiraceae bacterium]